jgi:hypothetical protein
MIIEIFALPIDGSVVRVTMTDAGREIAVLSSFRVLASR